MAPSKDHVFAVVRLDHQLLNLEPELAFKVVAVFEDEAAANADATRLNDVNSEKGAKYVVQSSRWRGGEG